MEDTTNAERKTGLDIPEPIVEIEISSDDKKEILSDKELACDDVENFVESNVHYLPSGMRNLFYSIKRVGTDKNEEEDKSHQ